MATTSSIHTRDAVPSLGMQTIPNQPMSTKTVSNLPPAINQHEHDVVALETLTAPSGGTHAGDSVQNQPSVSIVSPTTNTQSATEVTETEEDLLVASLQDDFIPLDSQCK